MKTMRVGEGRVKEGRAAKGIREVSKGSEKKETSKEMMTKII